MLYLGGGSPPWTLRKVIPCVLQPNSSTLAQRGMQADARTRDSGTTLTIDTSIPAHLNGTAFRKLRSPPVQNQHSNSDLHQSAAWYHGEPSAATHLSSEPAQKKQRPTKLEM